jgi:hypothetical protein
VTVACNAVLKDVPTVVVWDEPAEAEMLEALPAVLVRLKEAAVETPVALAVTLKAPALVLAVSAEAVATPLAFVVTATEVVPPLKVPLAPLEGAVKVTETPLTGLP